MKVVKVPENVDLEEYADELAKELEDGEGHPEELDDDLTPPVPSYLMEEEEREELSREERLRAFKHVTSNVADTLSQWLNTMEVDVCTIPQHTQHCRMGDVRFHLAVSFGRYAPRLYSEVPRFVPS